mgnify:CR=1 FL=1
MTSGPVQIEPLEMISLKENFFDQSFTGNTGKPVWIGQNTKLGNLCVINMKRDNIAAVNIKVVGKRNIRTKSNHIGFHNKVFNGLWILRGGKDLRRSVFLQTVHNRKGKKHLQTE